jgi:hypothetical protein
MSGGGYSRIEKDFLGNERMVHYDAEGNMLGASDVIREEDGTIRISNDPINAVANDELPKVEAIVPPVTANSSVPQDVRVVGVGPKSNMPVSHVVTYSIGAFILTLLLTLGAMSFLRSNGQDARVRTIDTTSQRQPSTNFAPAPDSQPRREDFPSDPRPRNDELPGDTRPFDQSAPDSNMDDNRPRIDMNEPYPARDSDPKPTKKGSDDPIDLRGDEGGKKDPPTKGDPGADPLRGDDIH